MRPPASRSMSYLVAVAAVAVATLARWFLLPLWGARLPFITFFPAVMVAAWNGGRGPGIVATALAAISATFFLEPLGTPMVRGWDDVAGLVVFVTVNGVIVALNARLRRAQERLETALDAAEQSERRFRVVADAAPVLIWMAGPDRGLTWLNEAWLRFTGRTIVEDGGDGWQAGIHPEDLSACLATYTTAFDARRPFTMEYRLRRHDGAYRWMIDNGSPRYDATGTFAGYIGSCIDITEHKVTEAENAMLLEIAERARAEAETERERAEEASRAKDAFLATVSHELRTPLSPILLWSRLLAAGRLDAARARRAHEVIARCAQTQAQLIEDLLDVSRIVAGKMRLEVQPLELAPVVQRAVDVVRPSADAKGVRVQTVLDTEVGAVRGDADRLLQVVWNLLANAIKFTPKGGRVQVALERVNSHAEVSVADTGQGIDPAFLPHVFERFLQADATSTRVHGGLGLGLAIVRHIVEAHGGTVRAESAGTGRGAVFTVALPLMVARPATDADRRHPTVLLDAAPAVHARLDGVCVLLVDDQADSNEVIGELLASCGAEVRTAASVAAARETWRGWRPDVVVSDVGMPHEDGYALIASLREEADGVADVPAVALTAYASRDDRIRLLSAGFQAHVPKPVDPAELTAVLANLTRCLARAT